MSDVTIPEDVMATARDEALKFVEWLDPKPHDYEQAEHVLAASFARAILGERELCAKIADEACIQSAMDPIGPMHGAGRIAASLAIAQAIRSSHE